jgi:hypothetical protein
MYKHGAIPFGSRMPFTVELERGDAASDIGIVFAAPCSDTFAAGFDMLQQGVPEK